MKTILTSLMLLFSYFVYSQQPGSLDTSFNIGNVTSTQVVNGTAFNTIRALYQYSDGSYIVGGIFNTIAGKPMRNVAKIWPNGKLDTTFNSIIGPSGGQGANNMVAVIAEDKQKRIYLGGWFDKYNDTLTGSLVRVNKDGSLDKIFNPTTNGWVYFIKFLSNGKILIAGSFTSVGGIQKKHLAIIDDSGKIDTTFNVNINGTIIRQVVIDKFENIYIAGDFNRVNGVNCSNLAKLNKFGVVDTSFSTKIQINNELVGIGLDELTNTIGVAGMFTTINNQPTAKFALLNFDGSLKKNISLFY